METFPTNGNQSSAKGINLKPYEKKIQKAHINQKKYTTEKVENQKEMEEVLNNNNNDQEIEIQDYNISNNEKEDNIEDYQNIQNDNISGHSLKDLKFIDKNEEGNSGEMRYNIKDKQYFYSESNNGQYKNNINENNRNIYQNEEEDNQQQKYQFDGDGDENEQNKKNDNTNNTKKQYDYRYKYKKIVNKEKNIERE